MLPGSAVRVYNCESAVNVYIINTYSIHTLCFGEHVKYTRLGMVRDLNDRLKKLTEWKSDVDRIISISIQNSKLIETFSNKSVDYVSYQYHYYYLMQCPYYLFLI